MYIEVYNRDTEELPETLSECIVYWNKGCAGSKYYKGEIYGTATTEEQLITSDSDESLEVLISRLKQDVYECACCHHIVEYVCETGACDDCEEQF